MESKDKFSNVMLMDMLRYLQTKMSDFRTMEEGIKKNIDEFHKATDGSFHNSNEEIQHIIPRIMRLMTDIKDELGSRLVQDAMEDFSNE